MNGDNEWTIKGSGIVANTKVKDLEGQLTDPGEGKHLWAVICTFHIADPSTTDDGSQLLLDLENLAGSVGPLCYKCEQPFVRARDTVCSGYLEY